VFYPIRRRHILAPGLVPIRSGRLSRAVLENKRVTHLRHKLIDEGNEDEWLALLKTTRHTVDQLVTRLAEMHSYEVPEILVLRYCGWLPAVS
jgi:hypothetical protein